MSGQQKRLVLVFIALAVAYAFERASHYTLRAGLVPALLAEGAAEDGYRTYSIFITATFNATLLGAFVAIGTGPRILVLIGASISVVAALLVTFGLLTPGIVTIVIGQSLTRACILAWFALGTRALPFPKRFGVFALAYVAINIGAMASGPVAKLHELVGPSAPPGAAAFFGLIAAAIFVAAFVLHGKTSLEDEIRGGMPEVGLLVLMSIGALVVVIDASVSQPLHQVFYGGDGNNAALLMIVNPLTVIVIGALAGLVATFVVAERFSLAASFAIAVGTAVLGGAIGLGAGALDNVAAAVLGVAALAVPEVLLAGVMFATFSYVHPRFVPISFAVWALVQSGTYQLVSRNDEARVPVAIAAIVLASIGAILVLLFRKSIDRLFGVSSANA